MFARKASRGRSPAVKTRRNVGALLDANSLGVGLRQESVDDNTMTGLGGTDGTLDHRETEDIRVNFTGGDLAGA